MWLPVIVFSVGWLTPVQTKRGRLHLVKDKKKESENEKEREKKSKNKGKEHEKEKTKTRQLRKDQEIAENAVAWSNLLEQRE